MQPVPPVHGGASAGDTDSPPSRTGFGPRKTATILRSVNRKQFITKTHNIPRSTRVQNALRLNRHQIPLRLRPRLRLAALPPLRHLRRRRPPPHHPRRHIPNNLDLLRRLRHNRLAAVYVQLHRDATIPDQFRAGLGRPVPARPVVFHPPSLLILDLLRNRERKPDLRSFVDLSLRVDLHVPRRGLPRAAAFSGDQQLLRVLAGESGSEGRAGSGGVGLRGVQLGGGARRCAGGSGAVAVWGGAEVYFGWAG
ncbi:hypothetical protein DH2020_047806 [Rehmannia glutinosa]|uniref:Uncharacterized protein n=1 Tax=Rehmannia glutinosa TaxID=99300 RepID=A0ABR0U799_REHGL